MNSPTFPFLVIKEKVYFVVLKIDLLHSISFISKTVLVAPSFLLLQNQNGIIHYSASCGKFFSV